MVRVGLYEMMWRTDNNGQAISVNKTETIQVSTVYFNVVLDEIPDKFHGVEVSDSSGNYTEVRSLDMVTGKSFHVDYGEGIVTFDPSVAGKNLKFKYYGRGYKKLHASRIVGINGYSARTIEQDREQEEKIRVLEKTIERQGKIIEYLANEIEKMQGVKA